MGAYRIFIGQESGIFSLSSHLTFLLANALLFLRGHFLVNPAMDRSKAKYADADGIRFDSFEGSEIVQGGAGYFQLVDDGEY